MTETWDRSAPGILRLPSGRLVRGRALSRPLPDGPVPAFGVYLLGRRPPAVPWESRWLKWPDFRLPADEADVLPALTEAWQRAVAERVEIACAGGHGRTGTALACLAILDGVPGSEAVAFVREHYDPHAVETPGQPGGSDVPLRSVYPTMIEFRDTGGDQQRQQAIAAQVFADLKSAGRWPAVYIDDMQKVLDSYQPPGNGPFPAKNDQPLT